MGLAPPHRAQVTSLIMSSSKQEWPKQSLWHRIADFSLKDLKVGVQSGLGGGSIEQFEQLLLEADFGVDVTTELVVGLEQAVKRGEIRSNEDFRRFLQEQIRSYIETNTVGLSRTPGLRRDGDLGIVLVLGVNGVGKTTTVAKLAHQLQEEGDQVLLAAADTWRAGAQKQLRTWADRIGAQFVGGKEGSDPASVAFDAIEAATSRGVDWVLIDTAGRLHTQSSLMEELVKIDRVINRRVQGSPYERLLVVDATSGQNVLNQARQFHAAMPLTGLILAKFDSSARAGTVVSVVHELSIPIRYLGIGETLLDLEVFSSTKYLEKIFSEDR